MDIQHFLKPFTVTSDEMRHHAIMIHTKYCIYISWFIKLLESMKIQFPLRMILVVLRI
jgi:hypothetical protein